jgi:gag-polypeptide of LTR copia-type
MHPYLNHMLILLLVSSEVGMRKGVQWVQWGKLPHADVCDTWSSKEFWGLTPYDMIGELKNMYQEQALVEWHCVVMKLFECKMTEGASISARIQKLMGLMEQLGKLGSTLDLQLFIDIIMHSLPLSFSYELWHNMSLYVTKWVALYALYGWDIHQAGTWCVRK